MNRQQLWEYAEERDDWDDMDVESKFNVFMTFITDLENDVERLERRVDELEAYL